MNFRMGHLHFYHFVIWYLQTIRKQGDVSMKKWVTILLAVVLFVTLTISSVSAETTTDNLQTTTSSAETTTTAEETQTTTTVAENVTTTTVDESEATTTTPTSQTTTTVADTTTKKPTSSTKEVGATTANKEVSATVLGQGTTAVAGDSIKLNVSTDTALLESFGFDADAFMSKAYLLLPKEQYTALVGRTNDVLMLNVRSTEQVSPLLLQKALASVSEFSEYAETDRQALTFDLSLLMLSRKGEVTPINVAPNVMYTVQLPVPASMKDCEAWAITVMDGEGLMTPKKVEVKNGMFELSTNSLEPYTIIGFRLDDEQKAGGVSWWLILLLVVGILLLAGAGTLLYFFVLRKPEPAADIPKETVVCPEDTDTDIFSGRTDLDDIQGPEKN